MLFTPLGFHSFRHNSKGTLLLLIYCSVSGACAWSGWQSKFVWTDAVGYLYSGIRVKELKNVTSSYPMVKDTNTASSDSEDEVSASSDPRVRATPRLTPRTRLPYRPTPRGRDTPRPVPRGGPRHVRPLWVGFRLARLPGKDFHLV